MKDDMDLTIPTFNHQKDESFLSMVDIALRIWVDILSHPKPGEWVG